VRIKLRILAQKSSQSFWGIINLKIYS